MMETEIKTKIDINTAPKLRSERGMDGWMGGWTDRYR